MRLRYGGIFSNLSLCVYSLMVKEFWRSMNIWRSYGQLNTGLFLMKHGVVIWQYWRHNELCSVGQANTIEYEEKYYRRSRHTLQAATQTRLDLQQQLCRSQHQQPAQRSMKHCSSDAMLLSRRRDSTDFKLTSLVDCPSRPQLTITLTSPNSVPADHRVYLSIHPLR